MRQHKGKRKKKERQRRRKENEQRKPAPVAGRAVPPTILRGSSHNPWGYEVPGCVWRGEEG
ncbi:MAG: hypothetical protein HYV42_00030 [Candidatus Magasanikbacteria bacterium]|nr:hypothetical protein [Candidatus Magasanikbacteria bacterium]